MPEEGVEPSWAFAHIILSDACIPVPPPRLIIIVAYLLRFATISFIVNRR